MDREVILKVITKMFQSRDQLDQSCLSVVINGLDFQKFVGYQTFVYRNWILKLLVLQFKLSNFCAIEEEPKVTVAKDCVPPLVNNTEP